MSPLSPARVELRPAPGGRAVLTLSGSFDVATASEARTEIEACLAGAARSSLEADASGIERGDMSGMAVLEELRRGRFTSGTPVPVKGLPPRFELLLRSSPRRAGRPRPWRSGPRATRERAPAKGHGAGRARKGRFLGDRGPGLRSAARIRGRAREGGGALREAGRRPSNRVVISLLTAFSSPSSRAASGDGGAQIFIANMIGS